MTASATLVEPAFASVPVFERTLGPEVADLARLAGFGPDPEQEMLLDAIFALDGYGRSVAFEVAVVVARQNMKTALFQMAALGWLFITDQRLIVWSAHEFGTTQEAFRDLDVLITGCDALRRRVKAIHRGNGDEAIELVDDRRLKFKARTKGGGRGLSGDKVILDEGFALKPEHMGALLPTLSARPDPQVLYGSSPGLPESAVLRAIRDRGRAGQDGRLAYLEWCAPPPAQACRDGDMCTHALDAVGCGCDDPKLWAMANPALGRRISAEHVAAERRAMPPAEFGRERMGWWDDPLGGESPIASEQWEHAADPDSQVTDPVAFGLDVAPDASASSVAVAGRRRDGLEHGELAKHDPGTGWVVGWLKERARRHGPCVLVLDPGGPAGALIPELAEAGFVTDPGPDQWRLHLMGAREYAQACGALVASIRNGKFRHIDQTPLNTAVDAARTRPLADAWAWSRKGGGDITPLVAVTLARHGHAVHGVVKPPEPIAIWGD